MENKIKLSDVFYENTGYYKHILCKYNIEVTTIENSILHIKKSTEYVELEIMDINMKNELIKIKFITSYMPAIPTAESINQGTVKWISKKDAENFIIIDNLEKNDDEIILG